MLQVNARSRLLLHGLRFLSPPPEIAAMMDASLPQWFQLFLGVAEVPAAVGLTLPGVTRIMPWLVLGAAVGVMIVMIFATIYHVYRGDPISSSVTTAVLLVMASFVAYGRWRIAPIRPRAGRTAAVSA